MIEIRYLLVCADCGRCVHEGIGQQRKNSEGKRIGIMIAYPEATQCPDCASTIVRVVVKEEPVSD